MKTIVLILCLLVFVPWGYADYDGTSHLHLSTGEYHSGYETAAGDDITASSGTTTWTVSDASESPLIIKIKFNDVSPEKAVRLTKEITRVVYRYDTPCEFEVNYEYQEVK